MTTLRRPAQRRPIFGLDLVSLGALAQELAIAAHRLGPLPGATLRRLLVVPPHPHLAIEALALHLLLQRAQCLIDIVVANLNLDDGSYSSLAESWTSTAVPRCERRGGLITGRGRCQAAAILAHAPRSAYLVAMTLRKLALLGHPVLLEPAAPVADATAPEIGRLIDDMLETMLDADGIGLAAPQVYAPLRVVVALDLADRAERELASPCILINPELMLEGDATELAFEGCLSLPGLRGRVPRHRALAYRGLGRDGTTVEGRAEGLFARVLQHEVDHLDGVLYPMRMPDLRELAFTSELRHLSMWLERGREDA